MVGKMKFLTIAGWISLVFMVNLFVLAGVRVENN